MKRAYLNIAGLMVLSVCVTGASLQFVPGTEWGSDGLNTLVDMEIYVPDNVVANPLIVVCLHSCGTWGSFFFYDSRMNQAADQYGFIAIVPSTKYYENGELKSGRCWDNGSTETLTPYGGADSEAIIRMVNYTINAYQANPNRVYAVGASSGAI